MSAPSWADLEALFHEALARAPADRAAFLAERCAGRPELQTEVEALLRVHESAASALEVPPLAAQTQLKTGVRLGPYEVLAQLGAGGMGEVYRARDMKLGRDVAIKILPSAFTADPERLARFEREARVLASLNHPNIGAIYGLEEADPSTGSGQAAVRALVLELVEGPTLAERLAQGSGLRAQGRAQRDGEPGPKPVALSPEPRGLPLDDVLSIARQIAEALEAAHEKGIIHRDLKPANIKITLEGTVKVLDFGLAKLASPAEAGHYDSHAANAMSQSPTITVGGTRQGVILGTAAYMSPEQARGQAVDKRADIWAFGCVLYEMLTSRQPFQGHTVTEVLASVLKSEPDFALLPPHLNSKIVELVRRCLAKDPKRRWHAAADVRMEIEAILADPRGLMVRPEAVTARQPVWRRAVPFAATALATAAIAAAVWWTVRPAPTASITRFSIVLPDDQQLTRQGRHNIAVSPDGRNIVYVADNQLYLRAMGDIQARPIPGTNQDVNTPFFSPDGQWIGFYAVPEGRLKKIAITGGASVTIADVTNPFGANWEADDRILVGQGGQGIVRVSPNGGSPETILKVEAGETAHGPQMLPDGEHVLFTVTKVTGATRWDQAQIVVQSLRSGERTVLIDGGSDARYVPTGHIVYALGTNLLAVPFDERSLTVTGGPVPILEDIGRSPVRDTAAMFFSFSPSGALAYFVGEAVQTNRSLALVDRKGESVALPMPPLPYDDPRISLDGKQLAVRVNTENESNIWIYDLAGVLAPRRLTFGGTNTSPAWAPDGRRIAFISNRDDNLNAIFWQPADGSGSAERLTDPKAAQPLSLRFSADGKIVYHDARGDGSIWILPLDGDRKPQPVIDSPGRQFGASFSPDGRWIAYGSNESGRDALYVQPYPPTGAKYQITTANSIQPLWSRNGRQIFYLEAPPGVQLGVVLGSLMSVDVRTASRITYANPTRLFDSVLVSGNRSYDVTPDGSRFVVLLPTGDADPETAPNPEIRVTLNWFEELRQRVPR